MNRSVVIRDGEVGATGGEIAISAIEISGGDVGLKLDGPTEVLNRLLAVALSRRPLFWPWLRYNKTDHMFHPRMLDP